MFLSFLLILTKAWNVIFLTLGEFVLGVLYSLSMSSYHDSYPSLLQVNGMGINFSFCSSEAYFRPQRLPKEDSCYGKVSSVVWIVKNFKLRKKNKEGQQQQQQKMGKEVTLEEWLLKSPIMEKDGNCNGDHCGFKHRSDSDYPSVAREGTYFSGCGEYSLSLEQLLNGGDYTALSVDYNTSSENLLKDEKANVKEVGFNSLTRSQSCKVKKSVSFRLPEVSETIILYPLEMDFKEC